MVEGKVNILDEIITIQSDFEKIVKLWVKTSEAVGL